MGGSQPRDVPRRGEQHHAAGGSAGLGAMHSSSTPPDDGSEPTATGWLGVDGAAHRPTPSPDPGGLVDFLPSAPSPEVAALLALIDENRRTVERLVGVQNVLPPRDLLGERNAASRLTGIPATNLVAQLDSEGHIARWIRCTVGGEIIELRRRRDEDQHQFGAPRREPAAHVRPWGWLDTALALQRSERRAALRRIPAGFRAILALILSELGDIVVAAVNDDAGARAPARS